MTIAVVSRIFPDSITYSDESSNSKNIVLEDAEKKKDNYDDFNHPRIRRALILSALHDHYLKNLQKEKNEMECDGAKEGEDNEEKRGNGKEERKDACGISFEVPLEPAANLSCYEMVHTNRLVHFLSNAWSMWESLGKENRQDPASSLLNTDALKSSGATSSPPLIPMNFPIPRINCERQQRPGSNVMGQIGYYCTDTCTPIFGDLYTELTWDAAIVQRAVEISMESQEKLAITSTELQRKRQSLFVNEDKDDAPTVVYALTTHPGHHSGRDSFGGYCYVNHAAFAARKFIENIKNLKDSPKVAILDVDYHCGNGTCEIFDDDPNVLVVSIHCHPDYEYPFHTGFADDTGKAGTTYHIPLQQGAAWDQTYKQALQDGLRRIRDFQVDALVVSLGLDTLKGDPCAVRRAGFSLEGTDYIEMGNLIGSCSMQARPSSQNDGDDSCLCRPVPVVFIQEGGYSVGENKIGEAVMNVLAGFWKATRPSNNTTENKRTKK